MNTEQPSLRPYLLLWGTQSLSALGSAMTGFALVIWLYERTGSALQTALLSICTYAPYVVMSIFAGALSDRWNKKRTMLACDLLAALGTVAVLALLRADRLCAWHMYLINALNGLMNTVQQPAAEVAASLLIPREHYQRTSGLRSLSKSLNTILMPVLATSLYAFGGMELVIAVDLATFAAAFLTLWLAIRIPEEHAQTSEKEPLPASAKAGLKWLRGNALVAKLIAFLAAINLVASAHSAALAPMLLSVPTGGEGVLGLINSISGVATLAGSLLVMAMPRPKNRIRVICWTLLVSMSTENYLLAFARTPAIWCVGAVLGWLPIPLMSANLDVILRTEIPTDMQGRVYACRNTLQFFTIPLGYFLGGILVDRAFEPYMAARAADSLAVRLFGAGKGSGAAMLFFFLGLTGMLAALLFLWMLRGERWRKA